MSAFHEQSTDHPLFPEIIWNKPESKHLAGNLLIIGGNAHSIAAPNAAYQAALKAITKEVKVVLPDATKKYLPSTPTLHHIMFAPSTLSGSFSTKALDELQAYAQWSDAVLIAGDISKNSESELALTTFIAGANRTLVLHQDAVDIALATGKAVLAKENIIYVCTFVQLQKLGSLAKIMHPFTSTMSQHALLQSLYELCGTLNGTIVLMHHNRIYTANHTSTAVTVTTNKPIIPEHIATNVSIWAMQQPNAMFKAITTSLLF